jgi:hypothetical protein
MFFGGGGFPFGGQGDDDEGFRKLKIASFFR